MVADVALPTIFSRLKNLRIVEDEPARIGGWAFKSADEDAVAWDQAFKSGAPEDRIIFSERDIGISSKALAIWFLTLYRDLGFKGASSHSGRRTFITKAAKRCIEGGGSLRDVQQLAGHSSLATTQRYIEGSSDAKRRIVDLIS
jgi:integrase